MTELYDAPVFPYQGAMLCERQNHELDSGL